ncbi:Uncharacterized conserved protein YbjT, contains NAD(P)-binding and DUF2867 domains [Parafrankia irregularis]|uniref:Uncharacterized conserved protein YbjT, contains NAD(P)-binding and DUF2867 domains n=1 Tax=Parafrankia irregularis TaxID=795642 RepID=A0A0S4QZ08_9ACTN|nr:MULTISPECIES: NAD(P)H-binding protein [Parafrankia]MBE3200431.1 NAD(P)H-binding protein [Parafrankia sp. CH37]CUU60707.1 Uncharacterized conserved protein YbjT, contains NAD(P)-binding and DUF2867 domains [Parafrankia irregularis]
MTILVTGATGAVGSHLVNALLDQGETVRALSRDPGKVSLPAAVEAVAGDLGDASTLGDLVFGGVRQAFVFPAESGVEAFMTAAIAAGVERFVVLSSLAAAKEHARDEGSASQLHHTAIEAAVTSRTDAWTILRPGTFANNLLAWAWPTRNGWPIRAPYLRSTQAPIHEADIADAAAAALLRDALIGRAIPLTGPQSLTRAEQIAAIGAGIGHELRSVEITPEEFRADVGEFIPEPIVAMLLAYWHDTLTEPDRVRPGVTELTGRPGRTLVQWAHDHRTDFASVTER